MGYLGEGDITGLRVSGDLICAGQCGLRRDAVESGESARGEDKSGPGREDWPGRNLGYRR